MSFFELLFWLPEGQLQDTENEKPNYFESTVIGNNVTTLGTIDWVHIGF